MINIAVSIALAIVVSVVFIFGLNVVAWASIPLGIVAGFILFIFLGRKIQSELEMIMAKMQRDIQEQKFDRAIATLKSGLALKNRHLFIGGQLNAQIGVIYYLQGKKFYDQALEHFKEGFAKHFIAQGMMACIYYKRNEFDNMKAVMDVTVKANGKEPIVYALYAYLLMQNKEKDRAIEVLQEGIKKLPKEERLITNLTQLQNNKKLKMKPYGDMWIQFMLERPPRIQQEMPPHMQRQMRRKQMFR